MTDFEFPIQRFTASGFFCRAMRAKGMSFCASGNKQAYSSLKLSFSKRGQKSSLLYRKRYYNHRVYPMVTETGETDGFAHTAPRWFLAVHPISLVVRGTPENCRRIEILREALTKQ